MYGKYLFFLLLLGGGAVLPYLLSDEKWIGRIEGFLGRTDAVSEAPELSDVESEPTLGEVSPFNTVPSFGVPFQKVGYSPNPVTFDREDYGTEMPLTHLLSFQATPEWITQNWERVTNRLGELDLHGRRVPYFRSGRTDDFAGSVTYYFDRARRTQRIVLHGYTSDASEFVQIATTHYRMLRKHSPEGDLYVATDRGQPIGALHLRYAPLLTTQNRERQCELLMELNRKGSEYEMSNEFKRIIRETAEANRLLTPLDRNAD